MKKLFQKIAILALIIAPLFALPVLAEDGTDDETDHDETSQNEGEGDDADSEDEDETESHDSNKEDDNQGEDENDDVNREDMPLKARLKERHEGRLDANKQRVCEHHKAVIERILAHANNRGEHHLLVFATIASRVEDFYKDKDLDVANYQELVDEVNSKHDDAEAAIQAVDDDINLDCEGANPVGRVNTFIHRVKEMHMALKDYRTAIKDLIVGIRPAAEAEEGDE